MDYYGYLSRKRARAYAKTAKIEDCPNITTPIAASNNGFNYAISSTQTNIFNGSNSTLQTMNTGKANVIN